MKHGRARLHRLRCCALAVLAVLTVIATGCGGSARQQHGSSAAPIAPDPTWTAEERDAQRRLFDLLNAYRAQHALPALVHDDRLAEIARRHCRDMRDNGFFGHDSPTTGSAEHRAQHARYAFLELRENVAQAPSASRAHELLVESPGHQANLVADSVSHVGIGVIHDASGPDTQPGYYFTQLFAKPVRVMSDSDALTWLMNQINAERSRQGLPRLTQHPVLENAAKKHVASLDAANTAASLKAIGLQVLQEVSAAKGFRAKSVQTGGQVGNAVELLSPQGMLDTSVFAIGLAIAQQTDTQGAPVVKMLLIAAR